MAKIGEGQLAASIRQGARELRAAIYPESNIAQPAEYGTYLTQTPGEIAEARRSLDGESGYASEPIQDSILGDRMWQAEGRDGHGLNDKQLELER